MDCKKFWRMVGNVLVAFFSALLGWSFSLTPKEIPALGIVSIIGLIAVGVWLGSID